jgi:cell division protein FtsI (penicillin-binding protein 3)
VQGVRSNQYVEAARRQRLRRIDLPAPRGAIYDRRGGELAISVPARTVYANPRQVTDALSEAKALAPLLGRPEWSVANELKRSNGFVYLARRTGVQTGSRISSLRLPGVGVLDEARRLYPAQQLGANVVGFIGTDQRGLSGVEYAYQELLGGKAGFRVLEQDPLGRRIPQGVYNEVPPVPGSDLVLTIDPDIELAAERALEQASKATHANGGMVVVLDPRSGEILAMASSPSFDPNAIGSIDPAATRHRAVNDAFEPGSINKVVVASAVLQEGIMRPSDQIWVPSQIKIGDQTFLEKEGARSVDLRAILAQSSNLGAILLAEKTGPRKLNEYFRRFGYGRVTGLDFPGETAGVLPSLQRWSTSLPTMAIGQGLSVSLLQVAQVYSTLANDGVAIEPRLVSGWVDPSGTFHRPAASLQRRVVNAQTAHTMRDLLRSVVSAEGTGPLAAVSGFQIAGKTGTALKPVAGGYDGYMSSFVGMLPAAAPQLVIAVTLDNPTPSYGGLAAAPVFSQIATQAVRILHIAPAPPPPGPQRPVAG